MSHILARHLLLWFLCGCLIAQPQGHSYLKNQAPGAAEFYNYLAAIHQASADSQISKLQQYLKVHPGYPTAYPHLLNIMLIVGRTEAANHFFTELAAYSPVGNHAHWMLARITMKENNQQAAYRHFRKALQQQNPPLRLLDDYAEFLNRNKKSYNGQREINRLNLNADYRHILQAAWYRRQLDFSAARASIDKVEQLSRHGLVLHLKAYIYRNLGQRKIARGLYQTGLDSAKARGDIRYQAFNLNSLGYLDRLGRKNLRAEEQYSAALALAEGIHDPEIIHLIKSNLASLFLLTNRAAKALDYYQEALACNQKLGRFARVAKCYRGIYQVLMATEQYNNILECLDRGEASALTANSPEDLYALKNARGDFYKQLNLSPQAIAEYKKAHNMIIQGHIRRANYLAFRSYADLLLTQGQSASARSLFRTFLKNNPTAHLYNKVYWQFQIGESFFLEKQYAPALAEFEKMITMVPANAKDNYFNIMQAFARLKIADLALIAENFDKARAIYQNDSLITKMAQSSSEVSIAKHKGLGNVYRELSDLEQAIESYRQAVFQTEKSRSKLKTERFRIGHFSKSIAPYNGLIRCYRDLLENSDASENLDSLLHYLEMSRSRSLRDKTRHANNRQGKDSPEYLAFQSADKRLQQLQRQIRLAPEQYDELYPHYQAARYQLMSNRLKLQQPDSLPKKINLPKTDRLLAMLRTAKMGLLYFHVSDRGSFVFAANDHRKAIVPLAIDPDSLKSTVAELLAPFYQVESDSIAHTPFRANIAHQLYQQLLLPVLRQMELPKTLLIVPDQTLQNLPFEMLMSKTPPKPLLLPTDSIAYHDQFLVQQYAIIYSPDLRSLARQPNQLIRAGGGDPKILVFANPRSKMLPDTLSYSLQTRSTWVNPGLLWYADREGDKIRDIYPATTIFKRENATIPNFLANAADHQILHFATHAFPDHEFDDFSGLLLAYQADSLDDGLLMGYEIENLNLNCELITLSACESGRGALVAGEGILGMPRLFLKSGAAAVLLTHWQVSDEFTSALMPPFYRDYLVNKNTKPLALQQAKLLLMQQSRQAGIVGPKMYYQHPFFWAPFALYGTPRLPESDGSCPWIIITVLFGLLVGIICYQVRNNPDRSGRD